MKLTAQDLYGFGVIDDVIKEPLGGMHHDPEKVYKDLDERLGRELKRYSGMSPEEIAEERYQKFRNIDALVRKGRR